MFAITIKCGSRLSYTFIIFRKIVCLLQINQAQSASEKVSEMKNNLRESFNLIEGYVTTEDDLDRNLLTSLSQSWSDSCRNLLSSLDAVLKVYLVSLRRFVLIRKKTGVDQNLTPSVGHSFDLNPSHEGVAIMKRTNETLSILLSDVITLFKRELKNNSEKANQPLVTRLDILQSRSKKVAFDLSSVSFHIAFGMWGLHGRCCDVQNLNVIGVLGQKLEVWVFTLENCCVVESEFN